MMKRIFAGILAAATVAASLVSVAPAQARNAGFVRHGGSGFHHGWGGGGRHTAWGGGGHYRGWGGRHYGYGWGGRHYWGGPRYGYYGGYDDGDAVAAGVAGLAVGALIGGALNHHAYGGSCAERFRSYNPATGTYVGYDGLRHPCP